MFFLFFEILILKIIFTKNKKIKTGVWGDKETSTKSISPTIMVFFNKKSFGVYFLASLLSTKCVYDVVLIICDQ